MHIKKVQNLVDQGRGGSLSFIFSTLIAAKKSAADRIINKKAKLNVEHFFRQPLASPFTFVFKKYKFKTRVGAIKCQMFQIVSRS